MTDHERDAIAAAVGPVGDQVGFKVIIPTYLPTALSRDVKADSQLDEKQTLATMVFLAGGGGGAQDGITEMIVIEERDPKIKSCPPCPSDKEGDYVTSTVKGHVVATKQVMTRAGEITHDMRFRVDTVHVIVQVTRATGSDEGKLTDDMSRDDFRIVESFFVQTPM